MHTKEYRTLVRELAEQNDIRIGKSWTDYLCGMTSQMFNRHGDQRVVTMEIFGELENMTQFWQELVVDCALRSDQKPRLTSTGYLKYNANIKPEYGIWSDAALEGLTK